MIRKNVRGLGDVIENVTTATGVKKVVDTVAKATGKSCGCGERRDSLNRKFPFKKDYGKYSCYSKIPHRFRQCGYPQPRVSVG